MEHQIVASGGKGGNQRERSVVIGRKERINADFAECAEDTEKTWKEREPSPGETQ
jgi:hypothetical protein